MKYVFYISDQGLTVYSGSEDQNKSEFFQWEDAALIDAMLVNLVEDAEADVVLDLIDEEIKYDWAPKVQPWEKQGIANRRKNRLENDSTLLSQVAWTGVQRVSEEGRKEELLLSSTISESYNVATFLQNLEEAQVILRGIHSKPFLLKEYFKEHIRAYLKLNRSDTKKTFLMISRQSDNVFRQSFFTEGELRLSRLVEIDKEHTSITQIKQALLAETKLAIAYVYNQKIVPFNSPIGFVFLDGDQEMLDGIIDNCIEEGLIRSSWDENEYFTATINFRVLAIGGAFCSNASEMCYSKQAIVDFVLSKHRGGFYTSQYVKKINNLILGRNALIGVNALIFILGLYYVLITGIDSWVSYKKQQELDQRILQHQNEKSRIQQMVQLQDDAQRIKASVEFSEAILKLKVNRLISFDVNSLSEVFLNNTNIQLKQIDWQGVDRYDSRANQINIQAWVFPFYETYHDPVMWVDKFVQELSQVQGVKNVVLQKEPLNRQLSQALTINTSIGRVNALPFTVTLRIEDDQLR